jgi:AraC family transcriptional regulator
VSGQREQLREVRTGKLRPVGETEPLLDSRATNWRGVRLEHHRLSGFELPEVAHVNHIVGLQLAQPFHLEWEVDGKPAPSVIPQDMVTLLPAGVPASSRSRDGGEFIMVSLTPQFLLSAVGPMTGGGTPELRPRFAFRDDLLRTLLLQFRAEAELGQASNALYVESLANCLATHLVRHYGETSTEWRDSGGLSRPTLRRVLEFIDGRLREPLTLNRLAEVAGLSPWHFAREFKQATGFAPHAHVLRARLQRVQTLLRQRELGLAEIATQTGFCDQSHLARHFRRLYGRPPAAWRREHVG